MVDWSSVHPRPPKTRAPEVSHHTVTLLPTLESPFEKLRAFSLLLNVFQSVAERAPVVVEFAIAIPNTPERLLYVRGQRTERDVRDIFDATVAERETREPERVDISASEAVTRPESVSILMVYPATVHEREEMVHERVEILPVAVAMLASIIDIVPESAFCALVSVK